MKENETPIFINSIQNPNALFPKPEKTSLGKKGVPLFPKFLKKGCFVFVIL